MEIKEQIDKLGTAFEEFKKVNDARLKEISEKGQASQETETKLAKIEKDLQASEAKIEQLNAALNRKAGGNGGEGPEAERKKASLEYKTALHSYMRKGVDIPANLYIPEYKDMSVQVDEDGGFFVTPEVSSEIVTKVFESSPVRELASVQTISSDALEILEDLDEAGSGWVGETQARSSTTTPQIKKISIPVHELHASPKATQKLLDDAAVNIEQWLAGKVSSKFARDEATAFISGNGVNKPLGILSYASGTSFGQVERELTASNSAIVADDLIDVQTLLKEPYQANASWLINRSIIGYVRKLKDSQGMYLLQPGLQLGVPSSLLGRPFRMASDLSSTIVASTDTIIYGDFRAGYQIVDRIGIRVLRDPYTAKPFVLFYTTKRVGGAVKNFEALKVLRIAT